MLAVSRLWTVLVGACIGAVLARVLLELLLGLDGGWVTAAILGAAAVGAVLSIGEAREVTMDPAERSDTILGWGAATGGVAAVACLVLTPMPWGVLAAAVVLGVTVIALKRVPRGVDT